MKTDTSPKHPCPARPLPAYALAFALMLLLESARLCPVLERLSVDFPPAAQAAALLSRAAEITGLAALSRQESRIVESLRTDRVIGTLSAEPVSISQAPDPSSLQTPSFTETPSEAVSVASDIEAPANPAGALPEARPEATHESPLSAQASNPSAVAAVPPVPAVRPKVLIVGDSLVMEGFGPVLQRSLRARNDLDVVREGKYSTGLTRSDQLDWSAHLRTLLKKHRPDVIVVCLGANDPQDIIDGRKKRHLTGSESWQALYRSRAERFLRVAESEGASVVWSGLPVMGRETYDNRIRILSDLQRAACETGSRCKFVDNRRTLSGSRGEYLNFAVDEQGHRVRLRYKDKIHVTEEGGKRLVATLLPILERTLELRRKTQAAPVSPPAAATSNP